MRLIDFDVYQNLLKERCGLVLEQDQSYLLDSRLAPIAKKWGYSSIEAMTGTLHGVADRDLVHDIVETMMTRDTSFFRDVWPFHTFADTVLPYMAKHRNGYKRLKIWCAASGTGQEPYSLALLIKENLNLFSGWKIEVLATDISNESLEQAKLGVYSQFEVQRGLPVRMLLKYFKEVDDNNWLINPDVRKIVKFQHFNMLDPMANLGKFDVICCRHLLGDFEPATRAKALERISGQLEKDGFLFLGTGKKETADTGLFAPLAEKRGVYVPLLSPHLAVKPEKTKLAKGAV